jgi:Fur family transcriptional regulator, zinc uptake regulator
MQYVRVPRMICYTITSSRYLEHNPMPRAPSRAPSPFRALGHDHETCIDRALDRAAQLCQKRGARLTALRRGVLALVWRGHEPVGAYAILDALRLTHPTAAPPTVYRALDFLIEQGLIHRIASMNAYMGCARPDAPHVSQFLICAGCGTAAELVEPAIAAAVLHRADALGFAVEQQTVEVRGRCPRCRERGGKTP